MTTVVVGTRDLRNALRAVLPCAADRPESALHYRVRLDINNSPNVYVYSTDGHSAALAVVSVWEDGHRDPVVLDLHPPQVRAILEIFEAPNTKPKDDEPDAILRIDVLDNAFEITDVSGLPGIDGRHYGDPRIDVSADYPDVPHLLSRLLDGDHDDTLDVVFSRIAEFRAATSAYRDTLRVTPNDGTRSCLVEIGESFLGLVRSVDANAATQEARAQWRQSWTARLPDPQSTPRNATPTEARQS